MLEYKVYNSISDIEKEFWEKEVHNRYFLSYNYLTTIENTCIDQSFRYVVVKKDGDLRAVFYFQLLTIRGRDLFDYIPDTNNFVRKIFEKSLSWINAEILILGNVVFTCEHGLLFKNVKPELQDKMTVKAISLANKSLGKKLRATMISENLFKNSKMFFCIRRYHEFRSEDRMEMDISSFNEFKDYNDMLQSKYRTRMNKIFSLNKKTEIVDIDVDNYNEYGDEIVALFRKVLANSKFNIAKLKDNYFYELLKSQSRFKLRGYIIDGKMAAFVSFFDLKEIVEVHYVGIDYESNSKSKVYNYMLYDMVDYGISHSKPKICFSRTSQELKSTLGAYPVEVHSLLKINNSFFNFVSSFFLKKLKPKEWIQRVPYKS